MKFNDVRTAFHQGLKLAKDFLLEQFKLQGDAFDGAIMEQAYEKVRDSNSLSGLSISNPEEASNSESQAELNKLTFEFCLREFLWSYRAQANALAMEFSSIFLVFDFLFLVADKGECDMSYPLQMIEEIATTSTISDIRYIVAYLSDRILIVTNQLFPGRGKGLVFLRLCNEMQRRCSKLNDAQVIGEIKILLTLAFPLYDKSGLNPRGDFDASNPVKPNVTSLGDYKPEHKETFLNFWKGQEYLASPFLLFEESAFADFKKGVNWSLKTFETNIRDARAKVRAHKKSLAKSSEKVPSPSKDSSLDNFPSSVPCSPVDTPRHLAEISLLPSQMCDPDFQKTIMVQYLIVFQYLLSLTPENSPKFPAAAKPPAGFAWKEQQSLWMTDSTKTINTLLRDIPFGSDKFPRLVRSVLKVESVYAEKKNVGYKPADIKQEEKEAALLNEKAAKVEASLYVPLKPLESMGSAVKLAHLWKLGEHNKVFPRGPALRAGRPELGTFLKENAKRARDYTEDDSCRQALSWKALRLASKTHPRLVIQTKSTDFVALQSAYDDKDFKRPATPKSL